MTAAIATHSAEIPSSRGHVIAGRWFSMIRISRQTAKLPDQFEL
jgi:hypothetical protein